MATLPEQYQLKLIEILENLARNNNIHNMENFNKSGLIMRLAKNLGIFL